MTRHNRSAVLLAVLAAVLALVLGACSGVPSSSSPEVVTTVPAGDQGEPSQTVTPAPGVMPAALVRDFLTENAYGAGRHASARTFLTSAARSRWDDTTATVLSSLSVGTYTPGKPQVTVTGRVVGTVDKDGVYTPSVQGSSSPTVQFVFGISQVDGQNRIGTLRSGLLLTESQFVDAYDQRSVYFYDLAHRFLVPDLRWVLKTDPVTESEDLVNELAGGPSALLTNAVSTDTLPSQAGTRHINVTAGTTLRIDIPGSSQLDATSKDRAAAQIAATLADVERGAPLEITDGSSPVRIPEVGGAQFSASDFGDTEPVTPSGEVYYVRNGRLISGSTRRAVGGAVNAGNYLMNSVAVSRSGPGGGLSVAAVADVDGIAKLVVGTQTTQLRTTTVTGVTSRPAFAPDRVEAWVGAGERIYRTTFGASGTPAVASVALPTAIAGQKVVALRLSPEGSRIALVLQDASGLQRLYVGAVVRTGGQVRVDTVQQLSPNTTMINDVAWVETQRLYAIGYDRGSKDAHLYQTGSDGSSWSASGIGELPAPPTTLTVAQAEPAWVTAQSSAADQPSVFVQAGGTAWVSPGNGAPAAGGAPVYLE